MIAEPLWCAETGQRCFELGTVEGSVEVDARTRDLKGSRNYQVDKKNLSCPRLMNCLELPKRFKTAQNIKCY